MIVIAGAGIGGLTLGIALSRLRIPFRIFERTAKLQPTGAGIALSANAFQAFKHIGIDTHVRKCGWELDSAELRNPQGRILMRVRVADMGSAETRAMTRADLHQTLLKKLETPVETGRAVVAYELNNKTVRVRMTDVEEIDADLLVGADGLHSSVRQVMRGEEALRYSGQTSWRGLVSGVRLEQPHGVIESWGPGQRFGIVPIGPDKVYWFAVVNAPTGERDECDPRDQLRTNFSAWHKPIDELLAKTPGDQILRTDIFDRPPIARWVDGRAVLLGDAAHPMTPNMGMGAGQAIEDAVVLADALRRTSSIDAALVDYETRRISRANSFIGRSFQFGRVAHLRSAPLRWVRDHAIRCFRFVPRRLAFRLTARDFEFRL